MRGWYGIVEAMMMLKQCTKCQSWKPPTEYHKHKDRKDGLNSTCKQCRSPVPAEQKKEVAKNKAKGLKRCPQCNAWKEKADFYPNKGSKSGLSSQCRECMKANAARQGKTDKTKARRKAYYWNNREEQTAKFKAYYYENLEAMRQKTRDRYHDAYKYHPETPAIRARSTHKFRASDKQAGFTLTTAEWQEILETQDHRCVGCFEKLLGDSNTTRDCIKPVTLGGGLTKDNVQAMCRGCNSKKNETELDLRAELAAWLAGDKSIVPYYRQTLPNWIGGDDDDNA